MYINGLTHTQRAPTTIPITVAPIATSSKGPSTPPIMAARLLDGLTVIPDTIEKIQINVIINTGLSIGISSGRGYI